MSYQDNANMQKQTRAKVTNHQMGHLHDFVLRHKVHFRVKTEPSGFHGLEISTSIGGSLSGKYRTLPGNVGLQIQTDESCTAVRILELKICTHWQE